MGDRLATIDMGQKWVAAVRLSVGAQQLPTFRPVSVVCVYVGFWTDHCRTETRVDENQLVVVEANNFMRVVRLCLIPMTGFSVNLASNHCVISLQDSTEHFPCRPTRTTRTICIRTLNLH